MAQFRSIFTVGAMSLLLQVSRSGFYDWLKRGQSKREISDRGLLKEIRIIFRESLKTYGCPRIHRELKKRGYAVGRERISRLMKMDGIQPQATKKRRVRTTDSNHKLTISPDLLKRKFCAKEPNRIYVTDITYIGTLAGWVYLCLVVDLFSRKIVGWSIQSHMRASLVCEAFQMACATRDIESGKLIVHSDRGSQYASDEFRRLLGKYNVDQSMSRKGECLDNAVAESINGTIKTELTEDKEYGCLKDVRRDILFYIEGFYNTRRLHSYLDYMSPDEFEISMMKEVA